MMNPSISVVISICLLIIYSRNLCNVDGLLWPEFTVMQVVAALSWPIPDPDRKAFINVGFQFNYNMPFQPSSFYDPMYWRSTKRDLSDSSGTQNDTQGSDYNKNKTKRNVLDVNEFDRAKYHSELKNNHRDVSAGELYKSLEIMLVDAGYHETCLLKSVCEVSRHPFQIMDGQEDLLAEIVQFVLTPSTHQGFERNENYLKERYEAAENIGRMGGDCDTVYSDCSDSIINNDSVDTRKNICRYCTI